MYVLEHFAAKEIDAARRVNSLNVSKRRLVLTLSLGHGVGAGGRGKFRNQFLQISIPETN